MTNDLLLALRTQRGWTQEELSERSGISVRTIRNLERGRVQSPRRSSLDLLFSVLDPERRGSGARPARAGGEAVRPAAVAPGPGQPAAARHHTSRWRGTRPPRTALIGRDGELDRLAAIVTDCPVTVLTGAGGIGKTRLALAVAERTAADFPGGVAVAQLGRIAAPSGTETGAGTAAGALQSVGPAALAAPAFGGHGPAAVPESEGPGPLAGAWQAVVELLGGERQPPGGRPALLVLDTAEHLPQTTTLLVDRLRGAWPGLRIMVTTRRPPVLAEARIWETAPLAEESALELMSRRLAGGPLTDGLTGSPEQARELCRELDCVPRLIEFAAYWLRSVPVSALLRPEHVLELLGVPDVAALPHQRSMRGSLDWSWRMLTPRQREFMDQLAERPGPVVGDGLEDALLEPEFGSTEAVRLLAELADASLLQVRRGPRYEYRMLRHVRAFVRHGARQSAARALPAAVGG
ncbi:helix-turn-helix domain-containing protein [Streptomyces sp. NBC_01476]|uniref:helix-turn-helix domain-containing protein n=1 Tax=Streptomyces sp. NBC_01476 TaxID=2903881 RepID=UPI002E35B16B|nr:helix-turn-helix domain-containing protein [Streptomyces sp. NBC_01476]